MTTTLIAGCGDIGTALALRRIQRGERVFGLRRTPQALPSPITPVAADLTDVETLTRVPADVNQLVYIVAADSFDDAAYRQAYVQGLDNLLTYLQESSSGALRRIVMVSSTSVYAQSQGEWVSEDSPTQPRSFAGQRLLEAEALLCNIGIRLAGAVSVVIRFGGIYGAGRNQLVERVRAARPCRQTPPMYTNRIHRDDCVGVLDHALELINPANLYLGVDCEPASQCDVMDYIAARSGCEPVPRLEGRFDTTVQGADPGQSRRVGSKRCSNMRLLESGYRFQFPSYREGYDQMLKSEKEK